MIAVAILAAFTLSACNDDDPVVVTQDPIVEEQGQTIVDVAVANGSFNTLVAALQATGLDTVLANSDATFTVFAPTDAAFALLGQETINALLADPDTLRDILLYHVISDANIMASSAIELAQTSENKVTMTNEKMTALSLAGNTLYVNKSAVIIPDVVADNGTIHVIDQVIIPPTMKMATTNTIVDVALADEQFSTLVTALTAADLVDTLANPDATFTVFAPTNAAFAKMDSVTLNGLLADTDALTNVLLQHVVIGSEIDSISAYAANGASVDTASGNDVSVSIINYTQGKNTSADEVAFDDVNQMLVAGMGANMMGKSLYVFDNDLGMASSTCYDACANNWPPVLVTDGMASGVPHLSHVMRDDQTMQLTFKGRPLYYYAGDNMAGDTSGQGLGGVWWTAKQMATELSIQGAGVSVSDIYTANGVIHVIDTVITETLE